MKRSIPHPKRLVALVLTGAALAFIILQIAGRILLHEGLVTIFVRERMSSPTPTAPIPPNPKVLTAPDTTRPIAVMIDNHPDALPQSGIDRAAMVFEAPVEGSLTRIMAVFRKGDVAQIGPVRSARPYFEDWAAGSDAVYAHFGGSDQALADLHMGADGLDDLDGMTSGDTFWRDESREAPHNAYTSTGKMRALMAKKSWPLATKKIDANLYDSAEPTGTPVSSFGVINIMGGTETRWTWNNSVQAWRRASGGIDTVTRDGKSVLPRTVVVVEVKKIAIADPHGKGLIGLQTLGTGKASVFRDGVQQTATWKKQTAKSQLEIFGTDGNKLPFAIGQVWYEIIASNAGGTITTK